MSKLNSAEYRRKKPSCTVARIIAGGNNFCLKKNKSISGARATIQATSRGLGRTVSFGRSSTAMIEAKHTAKYIQPVGADEIQ